MFTACSAWLGMLISAGILIPLGRRFKWDRDVVIVVVVLAGLGNTAFLGMILVDLLLDHGRLPYAIIFDQLGSFIVLSIACPVALAIAEAGRQNADHSKVSISYWNIARRILVFPPFICLLAALVIPIEWLAKLINDPVDLIAITLLPMSMLVVGLQFRFHIEKTQITPVINALLIKMVLFPAIVFALGLALDIPIKIFEASVLQAAMPPMVTPTVFLITAGLAPRLAAALLSYGTLIAAATLPLIAMLLRNNLL